MLINKKTRVVVQGILGRQGYYHTANCQSYARGKDMIVAGVHPTDSFRYCHALPVFRVIEGSVSETNANTILLFVPPTTALSAIATAARSTISLVVCIAEGILAKETILAQDVTSNRNRKLRVLGPNCPGVIVPMGLKAGIMPAKIYRPGGVGVISRSGTLTYEIVSQLTSYGLGQSLVVGVGGDPMQGLSLTNILWYLSEHQATKLVLLVGEIGGTEESAASCWARVHTRKPVVSLTVGRFAPTGKTMGHAGALITTGQESADAKAMIQRSDGLIVLSEAHDLRRIIGELKVLVQ